VPEANPMLEAYTTLGFLACATTRIKLGVMVSGVIYRPPAVLIKAATTVDVLAGGRTYFGVGAAWFEREARSLGIAFPPRSARYELLEETLRLARQTWAGDTTAFAGRHVSAAYPLSNPLPLSRPRPAILIGGTGPQRTLRLVAKYADAWNLITDPAHVDAHVARLRERCAEIGRDPSEVEVTALDAEDLRAEEDAAYRWTVDYERRRLEQWREHGVGHVIVNMSDAHDLAKLRRYGQEIIRALS
jgi:alkanesulfonate monooxygenase SsuD/methylene tetrahydromethanopterin reductase-like flavin-dependent oxidoreductase (luciferase family)